MLLGVVEFVLRMFWVVNTNLLAIRQNMLLWEIDVVVRMFGITLLNLLVIFRIGFLRCTFLVVWVLGVIHTDHLTLRGDIFNW